MIIDAANQIPWTRSISLTGKYVAVCQLCGQGEPIVLSMFAADLRGVDRASQYMQWLKERAPEDAIYEARVVCVRSDQRSRKDHGAR